MIKYVYKNNKLFLALSLFFMVVLSAYFVFRSYFITYITDLLLVNDPDTDISAVIWKAVTLVAVVFPLLIGSNIVYLYYEFIAERNIEKDIAQKIIKKQQSISEVLTIYNKDIKIIAEKYISNVTQCIYIAINFLFAFTYLSSISLPIVLTISGSVIILVVINQLFAKRLAGSLEKLQESNANLIRVVNGVFNSIQTVNIFFAQGFVLKKLNNSFENKLDRNKNYGAIKSLMIAINGFLSFAIQMGAIIASFVFVYYGKMTVGQVLSIVTLLSYITNPLSSLMQCKNDMDSTKNIRDKLENILNEQHNEEIREIGEHDIIFNSVDFSYDENEFIDSINLKFLMNGKYLIVGESGCGKSTLLRLILKEYDPTSGFISYNNKNIKELSLPTWYNKIGYCNQKIEILPGTITENIVLCESYDREKFKSIVKVLNLEYLSDKFDSEVNESTSNFSGGELQRIAIARMLYKNAPILLFDEFTSSLDNYNSFNIEKELLEIDNKLIINVSHRIHLELLDKYDKILIMENGKIKRFGNHSEVAQDLRLYVSNAQ